MDATSDNANYIAKLIATSFQGRSASEQGLTLSDAAEIVIAQLQTPIGQQLLAESGITNVTPLDLVQARSIATTPAAVSRRSVPLLVTDHIDLGAGVAYTTPAVDPVTGEIKTRTTGGAALPEVDTGGATFEYSQDLGGLKASYPLGYSTLAPLGHTSNTALPVLSYAEYLPLFQAQTGGSSDGAQESYQAYLTSKSEETGIIQHPADAALSEGGGAASTVQSMSWWDTLFGEIPNLTGFFVVVVVVIVIVGDR